MTVLKNDRRKMYSEIILLMQLGKNKEAFKLVTELYKNDTDCIYLKEYVGDKK